ncbi:MAG TPA: hypothetical protein VI750_05275 [Pyrinomonadaceae bacterium]|nr:hypothetical protein [Pyrinomonadaceae bacterium]
MNAKSFDPDRPICRRGIVARELTNGMIYLRHPRFSSRIINRESWGFLQLCDGRTLEELSHEVAKLLGFALTLEQLGSSVREFADRGVFEGTVDSARNYRICDASPVLSRLSPLVPWLTNRWFAGLTLLALLACLALLFADWETFTRSVASAARDHPIETVLLYYLTFVPIALLHELGHAVVASSHGAEVPEIVVCSNANFAVITNMSVLKNRLVRIWYLLMGTIVDIFVWLALLIAFHYSQHYLLLMFLLPQTVYALIYSYSIFKNSDFLKVVCTLLDEPVPGRPWQFLRTSWANPPEQPAKRKLLVIMTASLMIKLAVTGFLVWTFAKIEPRVLFLYLVYRIMAFIIGHWATWFRRWVSPASRVLRQFRGAGSHVLISF